MPTTQSADPKEKVDHPRHYNQHPSNIECIELIRHLPYNLGAAIKYLWRCGLKDSEETIRELGSALWYLKDEDKRVYRNRVDSEPGNESEEGFSEKWKPFAHRVIGANQVAYSGDHILSRVLEALLNDSLMTAISAVEEAIKQEKQEI